MAEGENAEEEMAGAEIDGGREGVGDGRGKLVMWVGWACGARREWLMGE